MGREVVTPPPEADGTSAKDKAQTPPGYLRLFFEAVLIAYLIITFVLTTVGISGGSMQPSLEDGERALVWRFETWLHRMGIGSFDRGDIVYFPSPESKSPSWFPFRTHLIKRIVAVGGDTVEMKNGQLVINGQMIDEIHLDNGARSGFTMPLQVVPNNHVFVLGDNRSPFGSVDSRRFGSIPEERLAGRAVSVIWPIFDKEPGKTVLNWRILRRPKAFREL
ncbi:MAG: signal peptidase I [Trueperaceae bacterium]|nr:MAG: signal peptidase I [Trueperaceae bacterium]